MLEAGLRGDWKIQHAGQPRDLTAVQQILLYVVKSREELDGTGGACVGEEMYLHGLARETGRKETTC